MPIEIIGDDDNSNERKAAEELRQILDPLIGPTNKLEIYVGVKCWGETPTDIDLLLLGTFGGGIQYDGLTDLTRRHTVRLINLCLIIEVKDHSGSSIQFDSTHVSVRYSSGWSDATKQSIDQKYSLLRYMKKNVKMPGWKPPLVKELIWLRNHNGSISPATPNVLGANFTKKDFLRALESIITPYEDSRYKGDFFLAFTRNNNIKAIQGVSDFLHIKIIPTNFDRRRTEKICKQLINEQKYIEKLGKQLLIFRGRGGSGKTIHLLRLANDLYSIGKRVLFLTYNKALVADLRRLMAIIGIDYDGFDRCVNIETVHAFFVAVLTDQRLWSKSLYERDEFPENEYKQLIVELLKRTEGKTPEELTGENTYNLKEVYAWDYVMVDEAQDWPEYERDLLYRFFGSYKCIIADGVDQLIRNSSPCDWIGSYPHTRARQIVPLNKAMRMKSNLCRFVTAFADEAGYNWDQEINDSVLGGKITIVHKNYDKVIHDEIFNHHKHDGNEPLDALFCVPPVYSAQTISMAELLNSWGEHVWDGTSKEIRETFPLYPHQHRIVKYQSCRGLEGWTVICLGLDRFYEFQSANFKFDPDNTGYNTPEELARKHAMSWMLIPLTRAIDHLVIQLDDGGGPIYDICRKLSTRYSDFVTWIE